MKNLLRRRGTDVRIYNYDSGISSWLLAQTLFPPAGSGGRPFFEHAVSIDGDIIVVGQDAAGFRETEDQDPTDTGKYGVSIYRSYPYTEI